MDVICINATFPNDTLQFYQEWGVVPPKQDGIYTIRDVIINRIGKTGLLLEELVNPQVPIYHPLTGHSYMEPNFDIERFSTLQGDLLDVIAVKQEFKTLEKLKNE